MAYTTISNTVASNNNVSALYVKNSKHVSVFGSYFAQNSNGIVAYTSGNVSVSYTVISNSSNGMVVWLCNYVNISHCTILYSDIYGMSIAGGDSISVENSIVKYSFYSGVCLDQNTNNFVRNVTVLYATMDIMIMDSVGSCVFDSTVSSSQLSRGVTVFTSNDTHIENVVFLATTSSREPPYVDVHYLFLESIRIGDLTLGAHARGLR